MSVEFDLSYNFLDKFWDKPNITPKLMSMEFDLLCNLLDKFFGGEYIYIPIKIYVIYSYKNLRRRDLFDLTFMRCYFSYKTHSCTYARNVYEFKQVNYSTSQDFIILY